MACCSPVMSLVIFFSLLYSPQAMSWSVWLTETDLVDWFSFDISYWWVNFPSWFIPVVCSNCQGAAGVLVVRELVPIFAGGFIFILGLTFSSCSGKPGSALMRAVVLEGPCWGTFPASSCWAVTGPEPLHPHPSCIPWMQTCIRPPALFWFLGEIHAGGWPKHVSIYIYLPHGCWPGDQGAAEKWGQAFHSSLTTAFHQLFAAASPLQVPVQHLDQWGFGLQWGVLALHQCA